MTDWRCVTSCWKLFGNGWCRPVSDNSEVLLSQAIDKFKTWDGWFEQIENMDHHKELESWRFDTHPSHEFLIVGGRSLEVDEGDRDSEGQYDGGGGGFEAASEFSRLGQAIMLGSVPSRLTRIFRKPFAFPLYNVFKWHVKIHLSKK